MESNEDGSPQALIRTHRASRVTEILWRFDSEGDREHGIYGVQDTFQDEYFLIYVWPGGDEDDQRMDLLSMSSRSRKCICASSHGLPQPYFIRSREGIRILIDSDFDPYHKLEALKKRSDAGEWADRIVLLDPCGETPCDGEVIIDDPCPERLWKVVHCSGATAWIKRTTAQKIRRHSKVKYVNKDTLIEMDLDSKRQMELELGGELVSVKFVGDFVYAVVKSNEGDHSYDLARIHRATKAREILWHFDPDDGAIELSDVFQDEYILIDVWFEREHDGGTELLRLSDHSRQNISTLDKTTLRVPHPYFVHSRERLRILIDSAIDPVDKMVAMEADSDPDIWADRIVLVDPFG